MKIIHDLLTYMCYIAAEVCVLTCILYLLIDPILLVSCRKTHKDTNEIKQLTVQYLNELGITIDKPIEYRFVRYIGSERKNSTVGTFHVYKNKYVISVSEEFYDYLRIRNNSKTRNKTYDCTILKG